MAKIYTALNKEKAAQKIYSFCVESLDFASFVWYFVCCQKKGELANEKAILI